MSAEVTVTLSDRLLEHAQLWADHSGKPVGEFLAEAIELSMRPLGEAPKPTSEWTDEEVQSAADYQIPRDQDERLSELLAGQREGCLSDSEASELQKLMLMYQERLLRKAMALRESVRRGLRHPLDA